MLCVSSEIFSQAGLTIGIGYSSFNALKSDSEFRPSYIKNFESGIYYKLHVGKNINLVPKVNLISLGSNIDLGNGFGSGYHFYYLDFPISFEYRIFTGKMGTVYFDIGPNLGIGLGRAKYEFCSPSSCTKKEISYGINETSKFKPYFIGINIGSAFEMNRIKVYFRYILGINGIFNEDPSVSNSLNYSHRAIILGIGYSILKR